MAPTELSKKCWQISLQGRLPPCPLKSLLQGHPQGVCMLANLVFFCYLNLLAASGTVDHSSLKYFSLGTHITTTSLAALSIALAGFFSYIQPINVDICQGLFLSPFSIHTLSSSNLIHSYGFKKYFMKNFNQIQNSILKPTYPSTFSMFCISTC